MWQYHFQNITCTPKSVLIVPWLTQKVWGRGTQERRHYENSQIRFVKTIKLNSLRPLLTLSFEIFLAVESFGFLVALLGEKKGEIFIKQTNKNKVINLALLTMWIKLRDYKSLHFCVRSFTESIFSISFSENMSVQSAIKF